MKAILISIQSPHACNTLNLIKLWEIRKKFPKDYVGWAYIYVTKNHKRAGWKKRDTLKRDSHDGKPTNHFQLWTDDMVEDNDKLNGKVVARFWCDKVEEIKYHCLTRYNSYCISKIVNEYNTKSLTYSQLRKAACLTDDKMDNYFSGALVVNGVVGYAIHITNLEIFDEPKEISDFHKIDNSNGFICFKCPHLCTDDSAGYSIDSCDLGFENCEKTILSRAPQSWCYVEM